MESRNANRGWHPSGIGCMMIFGKLPEYGCNRASSRLWRKDDVAATNFDELYTYDAVQRLLDIERGTLDSPPTSIINQQFQQDWDLDPTGNWKEFNVAEFGSATLEQQRTSNTNNEITNIGATLGTTWPAPIYDEAGNMFQMTNPLAPAGVRFAIYDGWGRMAQFSNGLYNLGTYAYDGLNRRIIKRTYASGTLTETRHCYFSDQWQVLEERVGSSTDPDRQYVWGIRYVDDLILRERDTDGNGTLDERLYALQDANWNVVAICDSSAAVQERYVYEPYGAVDFRAPNFGSRGSSSFAWSYLFTGRERDVESGLQYNRNRYLHLPLGCWTQRDPMGYAAGDVNLYRYVINSPPTLLDPNGSQHFDSFYIAKRPSEVNAADAFEWLLSCVALHWDIASPQSGYIRAGSAGPAVSHQPYTPGKWDERLYIQKKGQLESGHGKGKSCVCATNDEIIDCLRKYPVLKPYEVLSNNCHSDVTKAARACCLDDKDISYTPPLFMGP